MDGYRTEARKMDITWMGQYWSYNECASSDYGEVAKLNTVCWLEVHAAIRDVAPGIYTASWRIKLDDLSFGAKWSLRSYRKEGDASEELVKETCVEHGLDDDDDPPQGMAALLRSKVAGDWFLVSTGNVILPEGASRAEATIFGGNPHWCRGLYIDFFQLKPFKHDWCIERLLWLGCLKDEKSDLHQFPKNVINNVLGHLAESIAQEQKFPSVQ